MSDLPTSTLHIKKTQNIKLFFHFQHGNAHVYNVNPKV